MPEKMRCRGVDGTGQDAATIEIQAGSQDKEVMTDALLGNLHRSVEELELSVRTYNLLKASRIRTIAELITKDELELKRRGLGLKCRNEIKEILSGMGLSLGTTFYDRSCGHNLSVNELLATTGSGRSAVDTSQRRVPLPDMASDLREELDYVFKRAGLEAVWPMPSAVQADLIRRLRFARALDEYTKG